MAVGEPPTAPGRVEVAGEVQLAPTAAWATSSTSAAVERQDREHGPRERHGRASAGELVEVAAAPLTPGHRDRLSDGCVLAATSAATRNGA